MVICGMYDARVRCSGASGFGAISGGSGGIGWVPSSHGRYGSFFGFGLEQSRYTGWRASRLSGPVPAQRTPASLGPISVMTVAVSETTLRRVNGVVASGSEYEIVTARSAKLLLNRSTSYDSTGIASALPACSLSHWCDGHSNAQKIDVRIGLPCSSSAGANVSFIASLTAISSR